MSWIELSIHATHEAVDWVNTLLASIHYEGEISIKPYSQSWADADPSSTTQTQTAWAHTINLYVEGDRSGQEWVAAIEDALFPLYRIDLITLPQWVVLETKPEAFETANAKGHRIGERFVLLPFNADCEFETTDLILQLEPSLAFGSGLHPATVLSLQLIERYVTPHLQALDFGSGTGILSVAMAKLGAQVTALDNDAIAVQATHQNVQQNGVAEQVTVMQGSLGSGSQLGHWMGGDLATERLTFSPKHEFDVIVANVLARIHIAVVPDFRQALRCQPHGGVLITAGFTLDYQAEVDAALTQAGFEAIDSVQQEEWVALVHRIKG